MTDVPCLVKYENYSRTWMKKKRWGPMNVWTHLQLEKTTVMARALDDGHAGVLFADADIAWLAPMAPVGLGVVGVSPCLCAKKVEDTYGRFNGGHVFAREKRVLDRWRDASGRSRYMEQAALEEVYDVFSDEGAFLLDARSNVEWLNVLARVPRSSAPVERRARTPWRAIESPPSERCHSSLENGTESEWDREVVSRQGLEGGVGPGLSWTEVDRSRLKRE